MQKNTKSKIETPGVLEKEIMNTLELCSYTRFSKSFVNHLCSSGKLPYSKPSGKLRFFRKIDVDKFLTSNQ